MRGSQSGFTFLEILISLLIIGLGILGHASMQMKSTDIAQRAGYSQIANLALLDLAQRIRANSPLATAGDFDEDNLSTGNSLPTFKDCISDNDCTDAQFAQFEVGKWFTSLDQQLPFPRFSVTSTISGTGSLIEIRLTWDAGRSGNGYSLTACNSNSECQSGSLTVWLR